MAKQTFTTGQVLTAAQMTSLQQTAMLGGAASAKTASYTLVAADAGTAISMSNASATTITVNTALFAAGDTVQITNLGVGVCTITAGTATVNTSASLALAQYESGTLDFTSTSDAIFIKGAGAAGGGANFTLLNTGGTALTGATTITISGISNCENFMIVVDNASVSSASTQIRFRINTDTGSNYRFAGQNLGFTTTYSRNNFEAIKELASDSFIWGFMPDTAGGTITGYAYITGGKNTGIKSFNSVSAGTDYSSGPHKMVSIGGVYSGSAAITSISINSNSGNFDAGTIYVYGG